MLLGSVVLTPIGAGASVGPASFLDSSGQIVVAGRVDLTSVNSDFVAVRYQASDGTLDPTFGNGGVVTTPVTKYLDSAYAAVKYPADGTEKIVLAGYGQHLQGRYNQRTNDFALARYNADGTLDSTFGGQTPNIPGTVQTDLGNITLLHLKTTAFGRATRRASERSGVSDSGSAALCYRVGSRGATVLVRRDGMAGCCETVNCQIAPSPPAGASSRIRPARAGLPNTTAYGRG